MSVSSECLSTASNDQLSRECHGSITSTFPGHFD